MSENRFVWSGLEELKAALRVLPAELAGEAGAIVTNAAVAAQRDIIAAYPEVTGNLKGHVILAPGTMPSAYGAAVQVKSTAKHAYLYEVGTAARQTDLGYNRGAFPLAQPPGRVFIPIVMRHRRVMHEALADLIARQGLEVRGAA